VRWASTHFPDGSTVEIRIWGEDSAGEEREDVRTTLVYNKAYILGNDVDAGGSLYFGHEAVNDVGPIALAMNHEVEAGVTQPKSVILWFVPEKTAFFIYSHGACGYFGDCYATPEWDPDRYIFWTTLRAANDKTVYPLYNFAHVCGCYTGCDANLAVAFGVMGEGAQVLPDRAFLGWQTHVLDNFRTERWVFYLWSYMAAGYDVWNSVCYAEVVGGKADEWSEGDGGAEPSIRGDHQTRLVSVYGGDGRFWYR